ncbi:hypothetical protein CR513_29251 [Mucuna pruriens]|uniref:Uncharacterized protein n=1 Tax=Mucuna pruriens TaxID=157652 RepID=A0A371GES9_MUCPR|nr:hypothetical protein CR513_29251 [Mucuna pruriens]
MALLGLSTVAVSASVCPTGPRWRVDSGTSRIPSSGCRKTVRCKAVGDNRQGSLAETIVYEGIYGPWTIDDSDVREVILYRTGLVTAASSFVVAASAAFLPDNSLLKQNLDLFYVLGSGGLGLSLLLIHIYVSEIKRALQALWGLGVLGSATTYFALAQPANNNLIQYVLHNPSAVWLVGPLFAALTGLVFKEGLCYGKLEAGLLTFVIPILLLGHLDPHDSYIVVLHIFCLQVALVKQTTGLMDDGVKLTLLASWMTLFVVFAGRKFTQPIKDDIGDKSVFMFNSLRDNERKALLEKLQQQKTQN